MLKFLYTTLILKEDNLYIKHVFISYIYIMNVSNILNHKLPFNITHWQYIQCYLLIVIKINNI